MVFQVSSLEPPIRQILSAPGIDLETISAKRVRKQLLQIEPRLSAEFLREHKAAVDAIIASVFDEVIARAAEREGQDVVKAEEGEDQGPRGRTTSEDMGEVGRDVEDMNGETDMDLEGDDEDIMSPPKKAKQTRELADAELARQLSSEINGRTRRSAGKTRGSTNGSKKGRKLKSAAMVDTDDDDDSDVGKKKTKPKTKSGGGRAKGGFAKEYALSQPLAAVLNIDKLSRPQVVKQLWVYIKGHELQNPHNKREILCDGAFKAVFKVDKINMFEMNRVLGQHLHESEG